MKDVEVMETKKVAKKKVAKKVEAKKEAPKMDMDARNAKQKFMESRNASRAASKLPMAYSEEDIANAK